MFLSAVRRQLIVMLTTGVSQPNVVIHLRNTVDTRDQPL